MHTHKEQSDFLGERFGYCKQHYGMQPSITGFVDSKGWSVLAVLLEYAACVSGCKSLQSQMERHLSDACFALHLAVIRQTLLGRKATVLPSVHLMHTDIFM